MVNVRMLQESAAELKEAGKSLAEMELPVESVVIETMPHVVAAKLQEEVAKELWGKQE